VNAEKGSLFPQVKLKVGPYLLLTQFSKISHSLPTSSLLYITVIINIFTSVLLTSLHTHFHKPTLICYTKPSMPHGEN